jgi:ATP-dependent exoDNAse (exonuclease V) beta subunit
VLLRAFRPLGPLLVDELRRRAIAVAAIEREELLGDPRVATLRAALGVLDRPSDAARWSRLLTAGPLGFDPLHVRFALSAAAAPAFDATLGPALDAICSGGSLTGPELAAALAWAAQAWSTGDIGRAARRLVRRLRLLAAVMRDEPPSRVRAAAARLRVVCDALAAGARTTAGLGLPSDCADVLARFDEHLPALALDDAGLDPDAPGVRILTVHAAKGLEFERVFVADAVAGRFPQDARASGLLDERDRAVLARCGCDGPSVHPEAAALEEAALWYVALTRCKERLTITFSDRALDGEVQRPSRFIPFAARPAIVAPVERESIELRTLRCGDAAARARLLAGAALDGAPALADFARLGWAAFAPLDGYPLQRTRALAVGDAELWLQCPRRLFYRRFARLPDDPSATRELGSTLHAVLERFHALRTDFAPEAIDVAEWTRELLALRSNGWVAAAYESELVANAAAMAADVALRSYARALGERARLTPFRVEARELEITVPVDPTGPAALAGRIDRLDTLPDGSRVVVDYKLGHAKHQTAGAAVARQVAAWRAADGEQRKRAPLARNITGDLRLQLGFYASALDRVAAVAYIFLGGAASAPKRDGAVHEIAAYDDAFRAVVSAALGEIAAGLVNPLAVGTLRSFPVTHEADNCLHCPYTAVCPGPADRDK